jgi:hypothetical protein
MRPSRILYGVNFLKLSSFMVLKCFRLLDIRAKLLSTAVAAIMASADRRPEDNVYSPQYKLKRDARYFQ